MGYAQIEIGTPYPFDAPKNKQLLSAALQTIPSEVSCRTLLDYRGGEGEFSRQLAAKYPFGRVCCYEPLLVQRMEARRHLTGIENIELISKIKSMPKESIDIIFCLEVLEHYLVSETLLALELIKSILKSEGLLILSLPIEVGIPALKKGIVRRRTRPGEWDTDLLRIFFASLGLTPHIRPVSRLGDSFPFHLHDFGFDYRKFVKQIERDFRIVEKNYYPLGKWGALMNTKVILTLMKK